MEGASATYNIPLALRLKGALNEEALEAALNDVVERHEALRTVFPEEEGVPYQKVLSGEATRVKLRVESVSESELSGRLGEAAEVEMELEHELPLQAWLFRINEQEHVLLLVLHHIAGTAGRWYRWRETWERRTEQDGKAERHSSCLCRCSTEITRSGSGSCWGRKKTKKA
jgi:hypothetical protein